MSKEQRGLPIVGQRLDRMNATLSALREQQRDKAVPFVAFLYVENACNLRCAHCYESEDTHPTHDYGRLSVDEIDKVLGDLASLGAFQLTLSGGEIFLRRDILDIVALAKKHRFATTLFTSGYFLDEDKVRRLKELNVLEVDISVYSDIAEEHDAFTGIPGSWQRSVRALELVTAAGMKATLKCVLMTINVHRVDGIIALAHRLGVDFQFDPIVRPKLNNDRSPVEYALSPEQISTLLYARRDLYPGFQQHSPDRVCRGGEFLAGDDALCAAGISTLAIGANGDIYPCSFFTAPIGNVRTTSVVDVWRRSALLQDMRGMTFQSMSECPSCDLRSACRPCMAYSYAETGDMTACSSSSKRSAEALMQLAERGARAQRKLEHAEQLAAKTGRALPIVGDTRLPDVDGTAKSALAMFD